VFRPVAATEQTTACLDLPFGVGGKKRKSTTAAASDITLQADADQFVGASDDPTTDDGGQLKRRRQAKNSAGNGCVHCAVC